MSFTVAIVGRPNVGKSTLFNRLVGRRLALVDDRPGVTRDRREGRARLGDLAFTVIDTAGLDEAAPGKPHRPHAGADRGCHRRCRRGVLPDRRARRTDAGRPRLCRSGAQVRQAGGPDRQQERGQGGGSRPASRPMGSASAIRSRSPPSTARGLPISTRRCARRCRTRRRRRRGCGRRQRGRRQRQTRRSASPWSAGPIPANRR